MKSPEACENIGEIRNEIDSIDKEIINLFAIRFGYVKEIVRFKTNQEEIVAQKRYDEVIAKNRKNAEEKNLNPDIIEKICRQLMNYFIDEEMKLLSQKK